MDTNDHKQKHKKEKKKGENEERNSKNKNVENEKERNGKKEKMEIIRSRGSSTRTMRRNETPDTYEQTKIVMRLIHSKNKYDFTENSQHDLINDQSRLGQSPADREKAFRKKRTFFKTAGDKEDNADGDDFCNSQGYWCWYQIQNVSYTIHATNCTERGILLPGAYCTLNPVLGVDVADQKGRTPVTPEKRLDIRPDTPVRLQTIPLGFGIELRNLLLDFNEEEDIVEKLKDSQHQATIQLEHDSKKITGIVNNLDADAEVSWWESLFGYSPKATSFFNLLIHPVIILLTLVAIMYVGLFCVYRRMKGLVEQIQRGQAESHEYIRRRGLRT
ncbi:uncharacterized protein LOC142760560 [Rhinoderma darwinii]|uniref:uncharacterized protein LOC142760560 n=1 Tax=Rhinoderma darwinii TaxID=43563 RepID=UPI003F67AA46